MKSVVTRHNVKVLGGNGDPMLFAHGFGCDQNAWQRIISAFEKDHQIVLFDYIGAGKSDVKSYSKARYSTLDGYAQDIIDICHHLKLKNVIFVGHSVSCMIGALAAIKEPSIFKKLVFIGPSPSYINENGYSGGFAKEDIESLLELMDEDYISWAGSFAPAIMGAPSEDSNTQELKTLFCSYDHEIAKDFARVTFLSDNRKDLARIPVDSLTIQCTDDIIAPLSVGNYIKDNTPGNTLKIIRSVGHCPHMRSPQETIDAIREFI